MQAIVRVNQFGIWKACQKSSASSDNPSFGSHFALEIKTESTATYYGTLRNKLYDFFYRKRILRPVGNIVYIYLLMSLRNKVKKVYQVVEECLEIV
jgi:adenosylmethionine-8-amino-7-oxononanoate aminotransferase